MSAEKLMLAKTSMFFHHRLLDVLKADILPFGDLLVISAFCYYCRLMIGQHFTTCSFSLKTTVSGPSPQVS